MSKKKVKQSEIPMRFPYWNICAGCAEKKGGSMPSGGMGITVTRGECQYCKTGPHTLIPVCDFDWPGGPKAVWD